jgi:ketosteroid isomerase-like protein
VRGTADGSLQPTASITSIARRIGVILRRSIWESNDGMTTTDNTATAHALFARLTAGDVEGALALMTDDASWRLAGKPELTPVHGTYDKARLRKLFQRMLAQLVDGLHLTVVGSIAEGDKVALEVESRGDLKNGRQYRQQYHFAFTFRDGKIATVHEYLDTHHAFDIWLRPE